MNYLLDTCVISELNRPLPDQNVIHWVDQQDDVSLYLSAITIGELEKGICLLKASSKRERLHQWLMNDLLSRFENRIVFIDCKVTLRWGKILAEAQEHGRLSPSIDSLIAATALCHDFVLVTRNIQDMQRSGARLFNPWKE